MGAEEMVETLSDKNLALEEEIEKLQETVADLVCIMRFIYINMSLGKPLAPHLDAASPNTRHPSTQEPDELEFSSQCSKNRRVCD